MSFEIMSDIHVHYMPTFSSFVTPKSPVLVILGDVCELGQMIPMFRLFERLAEAWDHVLYVLGNHEYYGSTLSDSTVSYVRKVLKPIKNLTVLERQSITIEDTHFVGCTMWSDMLKSDPVAGNACRQQISDYMCIRMKDKYDITRQLLPGDTVKQFKTSVKFLKKAIASAPTDHKLVILTHHAPSFLSVTDRFKNSLLNGAFVSDLSTMILDNPQIKIWAHGHVHSNHDYILGQTRIVCHPCGYSKEMYSNSSEYKPLLIEG